jgi:hypothetical protein
MVDRDIKRLHRKAEAPLVNPRNTVSLNLFVVVGRVQDALLGISDTAGGAAPGHRETRIALEACDTPFLRRGTEP